MRLLVQIPVFLLERIVAFFDAISLWIVKLACKTEYVRKGQCQKTGVCCRTIGIEYPGWLRKKPKIQSLILAWYNLRYNFEFLGRNEEKDMLVFSCRYLTKQNTCGIYHMRPTLCREYPKTPWRGKVELHKGCGYSFELRKSP